MTRSINNAVRKAAAVMMAAAMVIGVSACGSSASEETTAAAETEAETETSGETEAEAEAEAEAAGGTLRVAMECAYAPYNWTQSDDSNGAVQISGSSDYAYGYDVMMAKKIAEELGMELEIVRSDWDSLIPALQSDKVDCVIAGQSITSECEL